MEDYQAHLINQIVKDSEVIYKIKQRQPSPKLYVIHNTMFSPHNKTYWPYQATVWWDDRYDIERWCYANLKSKNWRNYTQYFAFKREQDYLLFALRWL